MAAHCEWQRNVTGCDLKQRTLIENRFELGILVLYTCVRLIKFPCRILFSGCLKEMDGSRFGVPR